MATIDHRDFEIDGKPPARKPGEQEPRWWTLPDHEAAGSITATIKAIHDAQRERWSGLELAERLYGKASVSWRGGLARPPLPSQPASDARLTLNVVASVVDTVTAKIGKNRPRPMYLSSGGNYRQVRRAKRLNKFIDGIFYETRAHEKLGPEAFRDGAVWGDGLVAVVERHKRIAFERALPQEIYVDDLDGHNGEPRQLHRVRAVDRTWLKEQYPAHADAIARANPAPIDTLSTKPVVADLVNVQESWHLRSGPEAKDGKRVVSIEGHALLVEEWPHDFFPFVRFRWSPALAGFWSHGLALALRSIQLEISKLLQTIQVGLHLHGSTKLFVKLGSKIAKDKITNAPGGIIEGEERPEYLVPPAFPVQLYEQFQSRVREAYEIAGVSQLSAQSQKPAGLNSGKALREYNDIESDRFQLVGREYERFFLDLGRLSIAMARAIAQRDGDYVVRAPEKGGFTETRWSEIDLAEEAYVTQSFPVSQLPRDPEGRLQTVVEYIQAGMLDQRQGRRLLEFPDLEQVESLAQARETAYLKDLDSIIDDGGKEGFVKPLPDPSDGLDGLALGRELTLQYLAQARVNELEPEKVGLLRAYLAQIDWAMEELKKKAAEDAAAAAVTAGGPVAGAPIAPPVPPVPSELVPQVGTLQ